MGYDLTKGAPGSLQHANHVQEQIDEINENIPEIDGFTGNIVIPEVGTIVVSSGLITAFNAAEPG